MPTIPPGTHYMNNGWKVPREGGQPLNNQSSTSTKFSPISNAEKFDNDDKIEVDYPVDKQRSCSFFRATAKREDHLKQT